MEKEDVYEEEKTNKTEIACPYCKSKMVREKENGVSVATFCVIAAVLFLMGFFVELKVVSVLLWIFAGVICVFVFLIQSIHSKRNYVSEEKPAKQYKCMRCGYIFSENEREFTLISKRK